MLPLKPTFFSSKFGLKKKPDVDPENGIVLAVAMLSGANSVSKVISN